MNIPLKKVILPINLVTSFFISSLVFAGGVSQDKLKELSLGMNKDEIISTLGQPDSIQTEGLNEEGKIVERLEYSIAKPMSMPTEGSTIGQHYGNEYRPGSEHQSTYPCALVTVNQVLVRIEKQPEKPENNSNDYQPRMRAGSDIS